MTEVFKGQGPIKQKKMEVDNEFMSKKVADITVRELLALLKGKVKKKQLAPKIDMKYIVYSIIKQSSPDGITSYDMAKKLNKPYANVKYHVKEMLKAEVIKGSKIGTDDYSKVLYYVDDKCRSFSLFEDVLEDYDDQIQEDTESPDSGFEA